MYLELYFLWFLNIMLPYFLKYNVPLFSKYKVTLLLQILIKWENRLSVCCFHATAPWPANVVLADGWRDLMTGGIVNDRPHLSHLLIS